MFRNLPTSLLLIIALISTIGAIIYKIYSLNNLGIAVTLIFTAISFIILLSYQKNNQGKENIKKDKKKETKTSSANLDFASYFLITIYTVLLSGFFYILSTNQTDQAIISPWQVLPNYFFAIYFALAAILIIFLIRKKTAEQYKNTKIFLLILFYFSSFSVALIIYKIGFGFDSFIHEATLNLISEKGVVEPKPFYYLGYYSLVIIIHQLSAIPIALINKLLVPILASVYIPLTLFQVSDKWFRDRKAFFLMILFALILPFSIFILSTPQNLAFLFLLLIIILGLNCKTIFDLALIFLLALGAFLTQPVAGIPAILFALMLTIYHSEKENLKKYYYSIIFVTSSVALPFAFYLFNKSASTNEAQNSVNTLGSLIPKFHFPDLDNFVLNFVYLYGFNIKFILGVLALIGAILAWKHKENCKIFFIYFLMFVSSITAYFLTKFNSFSFLIDYEREDYLVRILIVSFLFLTPFIILTFYALAEKILQQSKYIKFSWLVFIIILITSSLYYSYPRLDNYFNSHGYSVSVTDIEAVRYIDDTADGDYIVLANQQVSVAALREFGFKKYYKNDIFYYPIPTGAPLYQFYLDMVYKKPSKETMNKAMDLAGVDKGYFVLNKYWWAFPKILEEAKLEANDFKSFNNGEVWVFEFKK